MHEIELAPALSGSEDVYGCCDEGRDFSETTHLAQSQAIQLEQGRAPLGITTMDKAKSACPPMTRDSFEKMYVAHSSGSAVEQSAPLRGVVAVVGCDGSGKTRLAKDLVSCLQQQKQPVERHYMGLVSGETGDKIKQLPFIGIALERYLAVKVRRAQDMKKKLPGTFTAVVMYLFSLWRVLQLYFVKRRAQSGVLVIAERYPQAEVPGFHYDGPGLAVDRSKNWFVRKLAMREQNLYERMARQKPSLVIRLTIDADTAHARKPDHPLAELRDKTEAMPRIKYNDAKIFEIDARLPYDEVLATALDTVQQAVLLM
jgi:thymidylate kinase